MKNIAFLFILNSLELKELRNITDVWERDLLLSPGQRYSKMVILELFLAPINYYQHLGNDIAAGEVLWTSLLILLVLTKYYWYYWSISKGEMPLTYSKCYFH